MLQDEESLWESIRAGNEKAFQRLFDAHYELMISYASKILASKDDCREVVQRVFIYLFEKRKTLLIKSLKAYLLKSVYHECLLVLKSQKPMVEAMEADAIEHTDWLDQAEREANIMKAVNDLPDRCREIFVMNRFEGKKNQEIASELGISKRTVETQISLALKNLRDKLLSFLF